MSCSPIHPPSVGTTPPEALSLLQQRLLLAEEGTETLIRDMGELGISRAQILGHAGRADPIQRPASPLKMSWGPGDQGMLWKKCDSLVSRVCRIESLLQTLKLTVFRLETERELDLGHTAHLKQQMAALQQESEEEQHASRRELMKMQDQLHQAYRDRDEACAEVQRMGQTLEAATAAKIDVALAAEELKTVKLELRQKLMEITEQMRQESARHLQVMRSHSELLQQVEEMERVVEMERRQVQLLQSDCQALRAEVQSSRQRLEEERERSRQLEEGCQQLKEQAAVKDSLVSVLKTELKDERSRVVKQLQEQDLLLEAARRNIQTELQMALRDKACLRKELEKLRGEHAHLLQRSSTAHETAATQKQTIERLQGELSTVRKECETRKNVEPSNDQVRPVVTKLEGERSVLDAELREARREVGCLRSALHKQQDETKRLIAKMATLEQQQTLQGVCEPAEGAVSQTLENILSSHGRLNRQTLHKEQAGAEQEPAFHKKDRLQAQREMKKHQAEVEKLQGLLIVTQSRNSRAQESLQKALVTAREDNKRLARSLEQAVSTSTSLHRKLDKTREQYQATIILRDDKLREAQMKIAHLSADLSAVKQQRREDYELSMKTLQREVSELRTTVKDSTTKSCDLSMTNQELRRRVSELERVVSEQKAGIREHRGHLRHQHRSRDSQKEQRLEEGTRNLCEKGQTDRKLQEVRVEPEQVTSKQEADWERWTATIQRWESKRELAHIAGEHQPVRTQLKTQQR
ncbi:coiled-coil domain-containing protein 150 isoform X3 [Parambassis ranga]|uniref:Coiled-coil domain-containing protein 150 isoform X3 n=1 Tax=Parambassis ranga TaxID=210632 RepID=A0A6P7JKF8_9TELE|nr:coiled-coil domain-containing protein 150 isoform X3 [Parambassis ranga]